MNHAARWAFQKACKLGYGLGCRHFAATSKDIGAYKKTQAYINDMERGCRLFEGSACLSVAWMFSTGKHPLLPKDPDQAREYFKKACHFKEARACFNLAQDWRSGKMEW